MSYSSRELKLKKILLLFACGGTVEKKLGKAPLQHDDLVLDLTLRLSILQDSPPNSFFPLRYLQAIVHVAMWRRTKEMGHVSRPPSQLFILGVLSKLSCPENVVLIRHVYP